MAEIVAINNTGSRSIVGRIAKTDPRLPNAFTYVRLSDTEPLGVVANAVAHKALTRLITSGLAKVSIVGRVKANDIIRLAKTGDIGVSQGQCLVAKSGDAPYFKIGTAFHSGSGLIDCIIDFQYQSSSSALGEVTIPSSFPYTATATDSLIVCDSATAVTVNLPSAIASSREMQIANVNIGEVTVEGNSGDLINGELNQPVYGANCMAIKDYKNNNWVII